MKPGMHNTLTKALLQWLLAYVLLFGAAGNLLAEVVIEGAEAQIRDNILAYLRLDDEACDAPAWRVRRLFADADSEIREALEVVGYYNAGIE